MATEKDRYMSLACTLADRYLCLMESVCEREKKKLPAEFAEYRKLRRKMETENNG